MTYVKLHIDYTDGPFQLHEDDLICGSESPYGRHTVGGAVVIDNLLIGTYKLGYLDHVDVDHNGNVTALLESYPAYRGMVGLDDEANAATVAAELRDIPTTPVSGGIGRLLLHVEPEHVTETVLVLTRHGLDWVLAPSPGVTDGVDRWHVDDDLDELTSALLYQEANG